METTIRINFAENEDYPCVIGMLNKAVGIKRTINFMRINVILSLNVTGLSQRGETDKGKL